MTTKPMNQKQSIKNLNQISKAFRTPYEVPGVKGYGTWSATVWDNQGVPQDGLQLTPSVAPWRGLFAVLDRVGATLSDEKVSALEEADAIVASCWRYGSFANIWASGEPFGAFRHDANLSRFGNEEMKRVNLEFSSGLAQWWLDRAHDAALVNRRTRAALSLLPMPWRVRRGPHTNGIAELIADETILEHFADLASQQSSPGDTDPMAVRREANHMVATVYRNGPVETFHAGTWSRGSEVPGYLRLTARESEGLANETARRLATRLALRARMDGDKLRELCLQDWMSPRDWSVREETSSITFSSLPGAGSLEGRLGSLEILAPTVYSI